jgi:hypothetical protein
MFLLLAMSGNIGMGNYIVKRLQAFVARQRHLGIERCNDWAGQAVAKAYRQLGDGTTDNGNYTRSTFPSRLWPAMSRRLPGNESVIPRLQWPKPVVKVKRAIIAEEHTAIIQQNKMSSGRFFTNCRGTRARHKSRQPPELLFHAMRQQI